MDRGQLPDLAGGTFGGGGLLGGFGPPSGTRRELEGGRCASARSLSGLERVRDRRIKAK